MTPPMNPLVKQGLDCACEAYLLENFITLRTKAYTEREFDLKMTEYRTTLLFELEDSFQRACEMIVRKMEKKAKDRMIDESIKSPKIS